MCEFVGWIEKGDKILFLTHDLIFNTPKGKKLQEWCENEEDYLGHGAIRFYFGLERDEGENKEHTNFGSPDNFPLAIVKAIKQGGMRGIGIGYGMLTIQAWAEYENVINQSWDECHKVAVQAWDEYNKTPNHERVAGQAWAKYLGIVNQSSAKYKRMKNPAFWDIFTMPKNRIEAWR